MISKEVFNQILDNGPNELFVENAGIIWKLYEIKHNKPVYKKYWIVDGKNIPIPKIMRNF